VLVIISECNMWKVNLSYLFTGQSRELGESSRSQYLSETSQMSLFDLRQTSLLSSDNMRKKLSVEQCPFIGKGGYKSGVERRLII
jgi:hypothetical protein